MGWNVKSEQRGDVDYFSFETFLKKFNEKILNTTCDAPSTRNYLSKRQIKLLTNPWISIGILDSVKNKIRIHRKARSLGQKTHWGN